VFTGIVSGIGRVAAVERRGRAAARLTIAAPARYGRFQTGESVAVSGVCLTAVRPGRRLVADLSPETLRVTTLGSLEPGGAVNLERSLEWRGRVSGHFVLGHVDAVTRLLGVEASRGAWTYRFSIPKGLGPSIMRKGSVAVDGVSLTVASRRAREFDVAVVSETRRSTTLSLARPGDHLNFEMDLFARYRWLGRGRSTRRSRS